MRFIGVVGLTLAALLASGCSSQNSVTNPRATDSPVAASATSSPQTVRSPTPTQPPSPLIGPLTTPIPPGTTMVTVTFLYASDSFATAPADVLYRTTITDAQLIQQVVSNVDAISQDTGATRGCTESSVNLRLDFAGPGPPATLDENSPCARATLIIGGSRALCWTAPLRAGSSRHSGSKRFSCPTDNHRSSRSNRPRVTDEPASLAADTDGMLSYGLANPYPRASSRQLRMYSSGLTARSRKRLTEL